MFCLIEFLNFRSIFEIKCLAECRLSSSTFLNVQLNADCLAQHSNGQSQFKNFGNITNSNVELNVDCRASDIECLAECRLSSLTFAKILVRT